MTHSAVSQKKLQPHASNTQKCTVCLKTIACKDISSEAVNLSRCWPAETVLSWLGGLRELEASGGKREKDTWCFCRVFYMKSTERALRN